MLLSHWYEVGISEFIHLILQTLGSAYVRLKGQRGCHWFLALKNPLLIGVLLKTRPSSCEGEQG